MFDLQPDRQPDGKMDGRCWSSTPAHRDRPERRGARSCYRPELSPSRERPVTTTSGSVIAGAFAHLAGFSGTLRALVSLEHHRDARRQPG